MGLGIRQDCVESKTGLQRGYPGQLQNGSGLLKSQLSSGDESTSFTAHKRLSEIISFSSFCSTIFQRHFGYLTLFAESNVKHF